MDGKYVIEVSVSLDGGHGDPIELKLAGDDLEKLNLYIMPMVVRGCAENGHTDGEIYVSVTTTENGEYFDHDEDWFNLSELSTWVCTYKDVLMELDDDVVDNLTYVLVPTEWLKATLREEGVVDFDEWLSEYTADSTVDIAWLAMKEQMIFACDDDVVAQTLGVPVGEYPRTPLEAALEETTTRSGDIAKSVEEKRYYVNEDYPSETWEDILGLTTEAARQILNDEEFIKWYNERNERFPGCYLPLEHWLANAAECEMSLSDKIEDAEERSAETDARDGKGINEIVKE